MQLQIIFRITVSSNQSQFLCLGPGKVYVSNWGPRGNQAIGYMGDHIALHGA